MNIGLDFDGVVVDVSRLKSQVIKARFGLEVSEGKLRSFHLKKLLTTSQHSNLGKFIFENREHGLQMDFVPGAEQCIRQLIENGHQVRIVTSRFRRSGRVAMEWLELKNLELDFTSVGRDRPKTAAATGLDLFVDDDLDKLIDLRDIVPNLYLFGWKYNREDDERLASATRVDNWPQLYAAICQLAA